MVETWLRRLLSKEEPAASLRLSDRPSFADGNNQFTLALYGRLRQQPGNLFFSPFSIRTALAMVQAGAMGETAAQMGAALCIPSSEETPHGGYGKAVSRFHATGGEHEMSVANSLWGQEGSPLQPEFLDVIARQYGGTMNAVDFRRNTEAARVAINQWVEDKTRRKIQDLIPSGTLDPDTQLVLANAVYFKAMWELQFRKAATRDEPFHLEGGGTVRAPLMHLQDHAWYMRARGYQAVELHYRGGGMSMLILLPDRNDGLRDLEQASLALVLHDCATKMESNTVDLFLPRFKIDWGTVDIRDQLTALGMPLAFSDQANFSGINGREPPHADSLHISKVLHKAMVDVNEEGTEAAAATVVGIRLGGSSLNAPVRTFRADHPFLFAIRDRQTGAILFLGRIADPTRMS